MVFYFLLFFSTKLCVPVTADRSAGSPWTNNNCLAEESACCRPSRLSSAVQRQQRHLGVHYCVWKCILVVQEMLRVRNKYSPARMSAMSWLKRVPLHLHANKLLFCLYFLDCGSGNAIDVGTKRPTILPILVLLLYGSYRWERKNNKCVFSMAFHCIAIIILYRLLIDSVFLRRLRKGMKNNHFFFTTSHLKIMETLMTNTNTL